MSDKKFVAAKRKLGCFKRPTREQEPDIKSLPPAGGAEKLNKKWKGFKAKIWRHKILSGLESK